MLLLALLSVFRPDTLYIYDQKKGCPGVPRPVTDKELAIAIWSYNARISRAQQSVLRQILVGKGSLDELLQLIDILKLYVRALLPFLTLRYKDIPLLQAKQPTNPNLEELYFFDLEELFKRLIMSDINIFIGIGYFSDEPVEFQESRTQTSSIRTTSSKFATYLGDFVDSDVYSKGLARSSKLLVYDNRKPRKSRANKRARVDVPSEEEEVLDLKPILVQAVDQKQFIGVLGGPIYLSDFVMFACYIVGCAYQQSPDSKHFGRVLVVGIDKRLVSSRQAKFDLGLLISSGEVIIKVQMLAAIYSLPASLIQQCLFRANEFCMFEGYDYFILPKDV